MKPAFVAPVLLAALLTAGAASARAPVVVELYTAQGCASCDKSAAAASALADRRGVIELTFNVDYWDYLGWRDSFAQPEFTNRQRAYDKRFGLNDVYTPQVIVDGQDQVSADKAEAFEPLVRRAMRATDVGPRIIPRADGTVSVEADARKRPASDIWLVRYEPHPAGVLVTEGDNKGKTVGERNVVRQLVKLGTWDGRRRIYHPPPPPKDGLDTLILVQGPDGGRITAAFNEASPH